MFNLGPGEVLVLVLLGILFLGPNGLPDLAAPFRASASLPIRGRWSSSDWFLVCSAVLTATLALRLLVGASR